MRSSVLSRDVYFQRLALLANFSIKYKTKSTVKAFDKKSSVLSKGQEISEAGISEEEILVWS